MEKSRGGFGHELVSCPARARLPAHVRGWVQRIPIFNPQLSHPQTPPTSANHIAENTFCSATLEILGYFSTMTQHFWRVKYQSQLCIKQAMNFLMKAEESAGCHQTFSSQVGSGDETNIQSPICQHYTNLYHIWTGALTTP